jgi:hypothetical protein
MAMNFIPSSSQAFGNAASFRNRRAAMRQTEEQRDRIFAKHQALVGTLYKNTMAARRAANRELNELPEYWDEDTYPRLPLNISSSCFAQIVPSAGGVFLYFRSNPDKAYFYPSAGTTAETAKRVYDLVSSDSLGRAYHNYWGAQNGARKVMSKSGKSYSYKLKGGKTLDLKKFDRLGSKLAGV